MATHHGSLNVGDILFKALDFLEWSVDFHVQVRYFLEGYVQGFDVVQSHGPLVATGVSDVEHRVLYEGHSLGSPENSLAYLGGRHDDLRLDGSRRRRITQS